MQFGSAGVGSGTHLPCVLLNLTLGVNITHVPYRGAGPVMQDLIGGRIDYFCDTIQTGAQQAKQGTVKGIAVMAPKRVPIIADLRDHRRAGPAGRRGQRLERLLPPQGNARADRAQAEQGDERRRWTIPRSASGWRSSASRSSPPERRSPEYLAKFLPEEIERWAKPIREAGISAD